MNESTETRQQFAIKKLYVKDVSFESPTSPKSFSYKKWEPKIDLNLGNKQTQIDADMYEVVLSVTATVSIEDETAFLIEVHQAGLFQIGGFEDEQKSYLLGSQCMNILFPYAREVISDMSVRGGFPPLILSPVNFDALYQQHMQQQQEEQAETGTDDEAAEVTH
ncbi:MAG: protein-export chaperone SecB [Gammaproteobacteria bacterium]